jgi:hypothetical protein
LPIGGRSSRRRGQVHVDDLARLAGDDVPSGAAADDLPAVEIQQTLNDGLIVLRVHWRACEHHQRPGFRARIPTNVASSPGSPP